MECRLWVDVDLGNPALVSLLICKSRGMKVQVTSPLATRAPMACFKTIFRARFCAFFCSETERRTAHPGLNSNKMEHIVVDDDPIFVLDKEKYYSRAFLLKEPLDVKKLDPEFFHDFTLLDLVVYAKDLPENFPRVSYEETVEAEGWKHGDGDMFQITADGEGWEPVPSPRTHFPVEYMDVHYIPKDRIEAKKIVPRELRNSPDDLHIELFTKCVVTTPNERHYGESADSLMVDDAEERASCVP